MRTRSLGLFLTTALMLGGCQSDGTTDTTEADAPQTPDGGVVLQVKSEGGFAPVEFILGTGPRFTLLEDGSLIHEGAQIAIFPGPLLPPYLVARLDGSQMDAVKEIIDRIGLPDMTHEHDDSAANFVADATTEVITYFDDNGEHTLSVYALGIEPTPSPRNRAFLELIETFDRFLGTAEAEPYLAEQVRVFAGPGFVDQEFQDIRPWPLDEDWSAWEELDNGWTCRVFGPEVLEQFESATQATTWEIPDVSGHSSPVKLLVRPLLPGETDCP